MDQKKISDLTSEELRALITSAVASAIVEAERIRTERAAAERLALAKAKHQLNG